MDAFEQVVAEILWREGYWVRTSFKVELTKEEKRLIGRASTPRWEIDVVAFNAQRNEIKAIECKSYMDSRGVKFIGFDPSSSESSRYKLFNDNNLREIVFGRLRTQLAEKGMCTPTTIVKLCLACGRVASSDDRESIGNHFAERGWEFWDEEWLRTRLHAMSRDGYENQVSAVVSKLLLRGR